MYTRASVMLLLIHCLLLLSLFGHGVLCLARLLVFEWLGYNLPYSVGSVVVESLFIAALIVWSWGSMSGQAFVIQLLRL